MATLQSFLQCTVSHKNLHVLPPASGWMLMTKKALRDCRAQKEGACTPKSPRGRSLPADLRACPRPGYDEPSYTPALYSSRMADLTNQLLQTPERMTSCVIILILLYTRKGILEQLSVLKCLTPFAFHYPKLE